MAPRTSVGTNDFNSRIIEEFRANRGRLSGALADTPVILIHHIGAKSGVERVTPVACSPLQGDRCLIVASNGGSRSHPSWYYNLKANPRVEVEVGGETFTMLAEELEGSARADQWQKLIAVTPSLAEFATKTRRQIPMFLLSREQ